MTDHSVPYASEQDVKTVLGAWSDRLPATIVLADRLPVTHAEVVDKLGDVYGTLPGTWRALALEAVRWAEAKIVAADILDITRVGRDDDSNVADKLRASAWSTIANGLPGQRPGDDGTETDPVSSLPSFPVSTGGVSSFADPYDPATDHMGPITWGGR